VRSYGMPSLQYFIVGTGFVSVILLECLYYWIVASNPLHRWSLLMTGAAVLHRAEVGFGEIAGGGTLHFSPALGRVSRPGPQHGIH
jgi:hypothetical protein